MRILSVIFLIILYHNISAQLYSIGLTFNDNNYIKAQIRSNHNSQEYKDLPESASIKKYCPKPGNQLQLNTSPSWATTWSALTILNAQKNNWTDQQLITQNTYSPAYTYYNIRKAEDENCEAGADLFKALTFLKNTGAKTYDDFLEFCPRGIPEDIIPIQNGNRICDFIKLFDEGHPDQFKINAVKKSISENYPVVIGMYCPPSFFTAKNFWQPTEVLSTEFPGQALCVVGYDENKYGGAFEVINSWGNRWGNDGFIWIRYADFVHFTKYSYEVFTINKDQNEDFLFSGFINLKLNTNKDVQFEKVDYGIFRTIEPLKTGTYFRIYLDNLDPAFVYVFGMDNSNNFFKIFPHLENINPSLIYKSNQMAIPGEDSYIEIIGDPGEEKLCVIYSKETIDFDDLINNLAKFPGSVSDNIDALLSGKLIVPNEISWNDHGIGFNAKSKNKTAIFIQIQILHI